MHVSFRIDELAVMRTWLPALRTLPSSTWATLSSAATWAIFTSLPLNENAEVREATVRSGT
jgi:hypothetical protein